MSGDQRATAERIEQPGIAPNRIAGDSCARTTWKNATRTATWLHQEHPGAPVVLITDPWQLPGATRTFQHQGLEALPIAAMPQIPPAVQNRLALRETVATFLYYLQDRM